MIRTRSINTGVTARPGRVFAVAIGSEARQRTVGLVRGIGRYRCHVSTQRHKVAKRLSSLIHIHRVLLCEARGSPSMRVLSGRLDDEISWATVSVCLECPSLTVSPGRAFSVSQQWFRWLRHDWQMFPPRPPSRCTCCTEPHSTLRLVE